MKPPQLLYLPVVASVRVLFNFLTGLDFLPRINGHPGKSTRLAGLWKLEEVSLS